MMRVSKGSHCSAINCSNNRGKNSDLSFFRFPKEPKRSKRWVINCRREDLLHKDVEYLSRNCCLCTKHFENSQFMNCNKNSLIKTAIPTLFEINNPPKAVTLKRKARQHNDKMHQSKRTKLNSLLNMELNPSLVFEAVWLPNIKVEPEDLHDSEEQQTCPTLVPTGSRTNIIGNGDSSQVKVERVDPSDVEEDERKLENDVNIDEKPSISLEDLQDKCEEQAKSERDLEENNTPHKESSESILRCKKLEDIKEETCGTNIMTTNDESQREENLKEVVDSEEQIYFTKNNDLKCKENSSKVSSKENYSYNIQDEKPYKCNICGKSFKWYSGIAPHLRRHCGDKPFKCEVCSKGFSEAGNLTKHMRIHTRDKPFQCGVCNRCFTESGSLVKHVRTHTGEKPYKCNVCNKRFTQSGYLSNHVRIHTGDKPFQCEVCSKGFTEAGNLRKHRRTHW